MSEAENTVQEIHESISEQLAKNTGNKFELKIPVDE